MTMRDEIETRTGNGTEIETEIVREEEIHLTPIGQRDLQNLMIGE